MPERLLLCTDLDRTLIPNGPQPESFRARELFAELAADDRVQLAYVTGRHRELVEQARDQYALPLPNFVIGDVGTTVYEIQPDGSWRPDMDWDKRISRDWNGLSNADLQQLLADIADLQPQEAYKQNNHKLSYYCALDSDRQATFDAINARLRPRGVNARLVWSVDEPEAIGLLDLLPAAAGKYHAVAWLQRLLGFSDSETFFSGDSGNDIEVLASPLPAVLVANSEPEVRDQALLESAANGHSDRLYIARGGFCGMNGNYSAGILEGIAHYYPALLPPAGKEAMR